MHRFNPKNAQRLDDPERLNWQPPLKIISCMNIGQNDIIIDFGCGTCFLSAPIARNYPNAKIYGVDISDEMLRLCREKDLPANIELVLMDNGSTGLPDKTADGIVIVNTFHELADDRPALDEIARLAKDNAKLSVVDWKKIEMDFGPKLEERMEPEEVDDILAGIGFETQAIDGQSFPYHYVIKATKIA